jgi:hypothetical protein
VTFTEFISIRKNTHEVICNQGIRVWYRLGIFHGIPRLIAWFILNFKGVETHAYPDSCRVPGESNFERVLHLNLLTTQAAQKLRSASASPAEFQTVGLERGRGEVICLNREACLWEDSFGDHHYEWPYGSPRSARVRGCAGAYVTGRCEPPDGSPRPKHGCQLHSQRYMAPTCANPTHFRHASGHLRDPPTRRVPAENCPDRRRGSRTA